MSKWTGGKPSDRAGIFTVVEEDSESDHSAKKSEDLSRMPDLVKDTVRTVEEKLEKKKQFYEIKVESYIVDPLEKFLTPTSCSSENLYESQSEVVRYARFFLLV